MLHWIKKIASVTGSPIGTLAQKIGSHFVAAEIRKFPFDGFAEAEKWGAQI